MNMDIVLELFANDAFQVDHDSAFKSDILHCAHIPQIVGGVSVTSCVCQPIYPLLT